MSKILVDEITPLSGTNTDLIVSGKGTGVPNLSANFKVGGTAGVPLTSIRGGGTSGQVITSTGASTPPTFQAAAGGATTLIQTIEPSGASTTNMNFTGFDSSLYDHYEFALTNVQPSGSGPGSEQRFRFLSSSDGGSTYDTGTQNYGKHKYYHPTSARGFQQGYNDESYVEWFGGFTTTHTGTNSGFSGYVRVWGAGDANTFTMFDWKMTAQTSAGARYLGGGEYHRLDLDVVDAVRFYWNGQNFAAGGSIRMYGWKKA